MIAGDTIGLWTLLSRCGKGMWVCRCVCGSERAVRICDARAGRWKSCGCRKVVLCSDAASTHGCSKTPEYMVWGVINQRCMNPRNLGFKNYGARGITVCAEWSESFEAFLQDVGSRPGPGYSIDRIDNNRDYEPGNVRWATKQQQTRNTRRNRFVTLGDQTKPLVDWTIEFGLPYHTVLCRLRSGWDPARALKTPIRGTHDAR